MATELASRSATPFPKPPGPPSLNTPLSLSSQAAAAALIVLTWWEARPWWLILAAALFATLGLVFET